MSDPHSAGRHVRVFISSTFRDMQEERDVLIKRIFPQLRKLCERRAVTWTEVDLRWGITDEQRAEGRVLPLCLAEIHRCRPYFIGLLGERYGWIPEPNAVSAELIESQPWLRQHLQQSVTELEILHGVFNDALTRRHAYFYFRDPGYLKSVGPEAQRSLSEANPERVTKLRHLKQRIREAATEEVCSLRDGYADPEQLGEWILEDFTKLIDRLYPEADVPDLLEQERARHEAYARSRRLAFIGREDLLRRLNDYAATGGKPVVVTGESGCGKTALLAEWGSRWREGHSDDVIIQHYIGSTADSADWQGLVRRILGELKRAFALPDDIPVHPDRLRCALGEWVPKTAGGRRVVLMLDGLNQLADGGDGARQLGWCPVAFPANYRLFISALPSESLAALRRRDWRELTVPLFTLTDIAPAARTYFRIFSKTPPNDLVEKLESTPAARNALYLRAVLDELRQCGQHDELQATAVGYLSAPDLPELFDRILERWERDFGWDIVRNSLSLIWAARRGLSEAEILDLLGKDDLALARSVWTPFYLAAEYSLVQKTGLLSVSHDYLRSAVNRRYLEVLERQVGAHTRLADYFGARKAVDPRMVDELFWQLRRARKWERLGQHLQNAQLVQMAWNANRFDVVSSWADMESAEPGSLGRAYEFILRSPDAYIWLAGTHPTVGEYLLVLAQTFSFSGYPAETFTLCDAICKHFPKSDYTSCRAVLLEVLCFIERGGSGDLDTAWGLLSHLWTLFSGPDEHRIQSEIMAAQETVLLSCQQADDALQVVQRHKAILDVTGDRRGLATCLGNEAVALVLKGEVAAALEVHLREEELCRELGDLDGLQAALGNHANVLTMLGSYEAAVAMLCEQEGICSEIGKLHSLANCYSNQAFVWAKVGRQERAAELLAKQEMLARRTGSERQLRIALEAQEALKKM